MSDFNFISIKVLKEDDLLKIPWNIKFDDLKKRLASLFRINIKEIADEKYKIYYLDNDNDIITISTQECFQEAK